MMTDAWTPTREKRLSNEPVQAKRSGRLRHEVFLTLNDPSHSKLASLVSTVIMLAILVSTLSFVVGSLPDFKDSEVLPAVEVAVVALFTVEYVMRLAVHEGNRCKFVLDAFNVIDLLAIVPFYIELIVGEAGAQALRVLRIVRMLRLLRHSTDMQMFVVCMGRSLQGLKLLLVLFCLAILIFSSLLWYCEKGVWDEAQQAYVRSDGEPTPFTSIPATFWWSIVTMTTVGYGDTYPVETSGKMVATFAMLGGVLVLAMPLSVVGTNFTEVYAEAQRARLSERLRSNMRRSHSRRSSDRSDGSEQLVEMARQIGEIRQAAEKAFSEAGALNTMHEDAATEALLAAQVDSYKTMVMIGLDGLAKVLECVPGRLATR